MVIIAPSAGPGIHASLGGFVGMTTKSGVADLRRVA
jgi:hypothetical protein